MKIEIGNPGAHTTVQDLGRPRGRSAGIPVGGAADSLALRAANLLVGNDPSEAGLECALVGPVVTLSHRRIVAICGAESVGLPHWQAFAVRGGESFSLERLVRGSYAYLAIAGGINVPHVLGSRSTDTRVGWGGHKGRTLRRGDVIPIATSDDDLAMPGRVHYEPWYEDSAVRVVRGPEWDEFASPFVGPTFTVTARSDRMGVRLFGSTVKRIGRAELQSRVVVPGTVQVPPDGQPIVLLADAQTMGGYPIVAHVISADLPKLAQRRPGATVHFAEVSLEEAHNLRRRQERGLAFLRQAIAMSHRRSSR